MEEPSPNPSAPPSASSPRAGLWAGLLALALVLVPGSSRSGDPPTRVGGGGAEDTDTDAPGEPQAGGRGELRVSLSGLGQDSLPQGSHLWLEGSEGVTRRPLAGAPPVVVSGLPEGPFALYVHVPGFVLLHQDVELVADARLDVHHALAPAALARVHVEARDAAEREAGGIPLTAMHAFAVLPGRQAPRFPARPDGDALLLATLPPDTDVVLYVSAPGHERAQLELHTPAAGEAVELTVSLSLAAQLAGVVVDTAGAPVPRARVVLAGSGVWPPRELETDAMGRFAWPQVPAGVYELRAAHGDLVGRPRGGIVVGEREPTPFVRLMLTPGAVLTGVVHDSLGAPIVDAEVLALEEAISLLPRAASTGAAGDFRMTGLLPQEHVVRVSAEGFVPREVEHDPRFGPIDVELQRAASIAGRVLDHLGHPVAGAGVEVLDDSAHPVMHFADLFTVQRAGPVPLASDGALGVTLGDIPPIPLDVHGGTRQLTGQAVTDATGAFLVTGVSPGRVRMRVTADGFAPLSTQPLTLRPGEEREGVILELQPGTLIDGRVVDAGDYPVANVLVELRIPGQDAETTMTAGDGTFTFQAGRGNVVLTASAAALPAVRSRVTLGDVERQEVVLRLSATLHTLRGRVFDRDDLPVAGATLRLESLSARYPHQRVVVAAEDGSFELSGLPPPPYRLVVSHEALADEELDVVATDDELRIVLLPAGTLRGTVVDDLGPAGDVEITLHRDGRPLRHAYTDEEGRFVFERIGVARYTLQLRSPVHLPAQADAVLVLRRGEVLAYVDEVALTRGAHVSGTVVDVLGEPALGAEVTVGNDWSASVSVDDTGAFVLGPVAAGDLVVTARHPQAGTGTTRRPVRVDVGELVQDAYIRLGGRVPLPDPEVEAEVRPEDPDAEAGSGQRVTGVAIAVALGEREVEVSAVVDGSRAARAGLRVGDQLIEVDDVPVNSPAEARSLLRGAEGVPAILRIRRARRDRIVTVPRERYTQPDE
ncbi:MAG: carboxypeptidase regulatory-like domain-containing protein [Sandaracinaceae bacterium]|nr:carboxypeptidase regulatory-like domain-containing protein [Myxococcales bacterium]MCB9661428.1 carboxypeptidase regulatory-like domain-containing protein [Sandaracinaceae bacterium]